MKLTKSLLLGSAAAVVAVSAGYAADLPSKKAAPASYVKICDAYGAGFFYIPGTDTCVKLGGYVRVEEQYTPSKTTYTGTNANVGSYGAVQDTWGNEVRGRITVDARTQSNYGTVQTAIALRGTGTTGLRGASYNYAAGTVPPTATSSSNSALTTEQAFIRFAGLTAGLSSSNYAMMPSTQYSGNAWAGFPNGMRQLAYTAVLGGGLSATVALEDTQMWGYAQEVISKPNTAPALVGNVRVDQSWGFAAIHGLVYNNSYGANAAGTANTFGPTASNTLSTTGGSELTKSAWAVGATTKINLPMLAAGDAVWLTANYTSGALGAILSAGSLENLSSASGGRILGGVLRQDTDLVYVGNNTVQNTTGWNIAGQLTHYWAAQWRSNFTAGYVEFNPPSQQAGATAWGRGSLYEGLASIIWSPVKDFDIGFEVQYLNLKNSVQNAPAGWLAAGSPGQNSNNWTSKIRLERSF
jgi:hypothetical protein